MAVSGANISALPPLAGSQGAASQPEASVWLSASAGTGKTQVLAARVFRLLLRGVDPGAILCLTFTKAGAAEMAARVSGRLAYWVRAKRTELFADLEALGEPADDAQIALARTLFAKVLDAPGGGLRIQTIHSFCQTLLSAFPVEAGLTPGFRPLEAREEAALAREALAEMLVTAEREGRGWVIDAVGALSLRLGEGKAEAFLSACARAPDAMAAMPSGIQPWLRRAFGLPSGDVAAAAAEWCSDDAFDVDGLARIADANEAWGTATGMRDAGVARAWIAADPAARVAGLAELRKLALTGKDEPRKVSAKLAAIDPHYEELLLALGEACIAVQGMVARAGYVDCLAQGLEAGREYAATYTAAKRRAGAVDFDDLIGKAVALLEQDGMGDWIRYKLDQATSHVLIDEAQDTNVNQWRIVRALADEFFAGEGAHGEEVRTIFAVGDYKQAIFGFQGTDPVNFRAAQQHFDMRAAGALDTLSLVHSFRSTAPVLEFVDTAIGALPPPGMGEFAEPEPHASRVEGPGTVTLWPPVVTGGDPEDEEGWIDDATRELANRIAGQIREWIGTLVLESKGRVLRPEDVMILVRRRGELAGLIVARLYAEGVPVAGVDRLRLNAPLAVQDLLAAVRFALQPDDDLSLAALLVSPLIGWTQDELMVAAMRERGSLWRHLRATQTPERLEPLFGLLARADFMTPHRFLEAILTGPMDGRRKLLHRLGAEALDPIEELLTAALGFEGVATPTLQRFLDWFDRGDVEIVRDAAQPQAAVRVMTAHGAKGLQAPLVILADATADPVAGNRGDFVEWQPDGEEFKLPVFRPGKTERGGPVDDAVSAAEARELEEHWRLFYVAATRAEERLVIAGALGPKAKGEPPELSWYKAAAAGLDALGVEAGEGERSFTGIAPTRAVPRKAVVVEAGEAAGAVPDWARRAAPVEARPPRPLAPSSLGEDLVADPPPAAALRAAAERGRLIHALLERLPVVAAERRADVAERWLTGAGGVEDAGARAELARAALGVLAEPRFAELFGPEALAEAPVAAVVGGGHVVSGTADRLLVTDNRVLVVDFKTGRRAPGALGDVPPYHVRQMAAYVAALEVIFPGREVVAGLLYTAGPVLFELPADLVAAHKPGFAGSEQSLALDA
ncbi:double-strand break repair helicase AddA [Sphingomonas sp.]|uniref:double-strand break repair helicase AddA n=1 Tax=Sphingomonas sp. TaxID=28214 RepID=UPI003F7071DD